MRYVALSAALWLAGCGGEDGEATEGPASCDGGGPLLVEIGSGGLRGFEPFADGDAIGLSAQQTVNLELLTSGIDTAANATVVIRADIGGAARGGAASYQLQCDDALGNGWLGAQVLVPEDAVAGDTLHVVAVVTGADGDSATGEVDLLLE